MAAVYVLYSKSADRYYIGSCLELARRLEDHKSKVYPDAYTAHSNDWELYYAMENLEYEQARRIELHVKRMKSRKYLSDLKLYPEISEKLRKK